MRQLDLFGFDSEPQQAAPPQRKNVTVLHATPPPAVSDNATLVFADNKIGIKIKLKREVPLTDDTTQLPAVPKTGEKDPVLEIEETITAEITVEETEPAALIQLTIEDAIQEVIKEAADEEINIATTPEEEMQTPVDETLQEPQLPEPTPVAAHQPLIKPAVISIEDEQPELVNEAPEALEETEAEEETSEPEFTASIAEAEPSVDTEVGEGLPEETVTPAPAQQWLVKPAIISIEEEPEEQLPEQHRVAETPETIQHESSIRPFLARPAVIEIEDEQPAVESETGSQPAIVNDEPEIPVISNEENNREEEDIAQVIAQVPEETIATEPEESVVESKEIVAEPEEAIVEPEEKIAQPEETFAVTEDETVVTAQEEIVASAEEKIAEPAVEDVTIPEAVETSTSAGKEIATPAAAEEIAAPVAEELPAPVLEETVTPAKEPEPAPTLLQQEPVLPAPPPVKIKAPKPSPKEQPAPKKRGRKSFKEIDAETDLIQLPDDDALFEKQYYPISVVAGWFNVNASLLRFWENEFDILKPRKNRKGDRLFRPEDVKNLQVIYYLLRQRKFTIEGAKEYLKTNKKKADTNTQLIQSLTKLRGFLLEFKANLE